MNIFEKFKYQLKITKEIDKLNKIVKHLEKQTKKNPNIVNQDISEDDKKKSLDSLDKIIRYKSFIGEDASIEKDFYNNLINS